MIPSVIQTRFGAEFNVLEPRVEDVMIGDIAWALSMQCRYAGHTLWPYSVAQHSILLSYAVPEEYAFEALLHDASEAYASDIVRPLKIALPDYKIYEDKIMACIAAALGFKYPLPEIVKEYDSRILHNERQVLFSNPFDWGLPGEPLPNVIITPEPQWKIFEDFTCRYIQLSSERLK